MSDKISEKEFKKMWNSNSATDWQLAIATMLLTAFVIMPLTYVALCCCLNLLVEPGRYNVLISCILGVVVSTITFILTWTVFTAQE